MPETVLIVDDEKGIRESLTDIFTDEGYTVITAASAEEALDIIGAERPDLVLLDIWLPGMDGISALEKIKAETPDVPVVMISGHGNIELAVKATKTGAYDFLEKPLSLERVILTSKRALEKSLLEAENRTLREVISKRGRIVGSSKRIKDMLAQIEMAAKGNSRVLITGESGAGKELAARMLHDQSPRSGMPFIELNCAAIPRELIESELFGHEKGSFTGALETKKGKFELADMGTLFLDEVADMSPESQAKLLRVIESQRFERVGGSRSIKVDVRIISATNKDLRERSKSGLFRDDLFYRLNVIPIYVPPLRTHKEDIPQLVEHFLEVLALEYGKARKMISAEAIDELKEYDWPGNIREIRNLIERLVIMTPGDTIKSVSPGGLGGGVERDFVGGKTLRDARDSFEKEFIVTKLRENDWNISKTAEALEIERSNLHRKIKALDIKIP